MIIILSHSEKSETRISSFLITESLEVCVRHPKVARYLCAGASTIAGCSEKYPKNRISKYTI